MSRTIFAIAFAGLIFSGASGTSHAAPILPLPATATGDIVGVIAGGACTVVVGVGAVTVA